MNKHFRKMYILSNLQIIQNIYVFKKINEGLGIQQVKQLENQ